MSGVGGPWPGDDWARVETAVRAATYEKIKAAAIRSGLSVRQLLSVVLRDVDWDQLKYRDWGPVLVESTEKKGLVDGEAEASGR